MLTVSAGIPATLATSSTMCFTCVSQSAFVYFVQYSFVSVRACAQFVPLDSAHKRRLLITSLRFYIRSHQATLSLWTLRTFNRFFLQTMVTSHVANSTMCAGVAITFIPMPYSPLQASFRACHDAYAMQWHCTIDFSSF